MNVWFWVIYMPIIAVLRFGFGLDWWIGFPVAGVVYLGVQAWKGIQK